MLCIGAERIPIEPNAYPLRIGLGGGRQGPSTSQRNFSRALAGQHRVERRHVDANRGRRLAHDQPDGRCAARRADADSHDPAGLLDRLACRYPRRPSGSPTFAPDDAGVDAAVCRGSRRTDARGCRDSLAATRDDLCPRPGECVGRTGMGFDRPRRRHPATGTHRHQRQQRWIQRRASNWTSNWRIRCGCHRPGLRVSD